MKRRDEGDLLEVPVVARRRSPFRSEADPVIGDDDDERVVVGARLLEPVQDEPELRSV